MTASGTLLSILREGRPLVLPGVYDAFGAMMAERAGFEAVYLSGACLAYSSLGRPDVGLIDASELVSAAQRICARVSLPVVVDADTGFGGALNVERSVERLAIAGVAAIQLEDQEFPKRCGHLGGKRVVPRREMVAKLRAAVCARGEGGPLIVARTDAIAVEGFADAMDRADAYLEAGADVLFVEALEDESQIAAVADRFSKRVALVLNQVEGGRTPLLSPARYRELGIQIILFPGGLFRAVAHTMDQYFKSLRESGSSDAFRDRMLDFSALNGVLGTEKELARADSYAIGEARGKEDR